MEAPAPPATHPFSSVSRTPMWRTCPPIIRLVYKEVTTLTADPPDGIKVFPNEEDLTDLQVTIEGPEGTPYAGGLFRMKLLLGKDFPASSPPKGYFLTKIFHPNVGANGEICVNVLKRDWTAELGSRHVLLTIKCLLITPKPESALNAEGCRCSWRTTRSTPPEPACSRRSTGAPAGPAAPRPAGRPGCGAQPPLADHLAPGGPGGADGPVARSTRASGTRSWQPRKRRTRSGRCGGCSGSSPALPTSPSPTLTPNSVSKLLNYGWGGGGYGGHRDLDLFF
uniref:Ubiquitin conjugating enzyme E2 S n=1 Tax=Lynx canadensis TaxID=61383 RepID=A0A667I1P0_LYNCA